MRINIRSERTYSISIEGITHDEATALRDLMKNSQFASGEEPMTECLIRQAIFNALTDALNAPQFAAPFPQASAGIPKYIDLEEGDLIHAGDECDSSPDNWRGEVQWVPVRDSSIGVCVPDPRHPTHTRYRRPIN